MAKIRRVEPAGEDKFSAGALRWAMAHIDGRVVAMVNCGAGHPMAVGLDMIRGDGLVTAEVVCPTCRLVTGMLLVDWAKWWRGGGST